MIFAFLSLQTPAPPSPGTIDRMPGFFRDAGIVIGIGVFLLILLMVWAKYIRPPRRERAHTHSPSRAAREEESDGDSGSSADSDGKHHHRRRRHRRAHRSLNPTLAETGGLPPPRAEDENPRAT